MIPTAIGLMAAVPGAAQSSKPNIVFVMMDNFGYGEIGAYGGGVLRGAATPNMDGVAKDGMKLTNFNTEIVCSTSRAALLTGRFAVRTGIGYVDKSENAGLTQWEVTLAEMLGKAGYASGYFGKWHLGSRDGRFPTDQGFDQWYGISETSHEAMWIDADGYDPQYAEPLYTLEGRKGGTTRRLALYDMEERSKFDGQVTDRAVAYIREAAEAGKPFLALISLTTGHVPTIASPQWRGHTGKGSWPDVLAQLDSYIGAILGAIRESGIQDDTIFILTADNGAELTYGMGLRIPGPTPGATGPWRGGLGTPYEGGIRVPFLIRWPGKIAAGTESNEMAHLVDIFPTLAAAAGGAVPDDRPVDGVNLLPFFKGAKKESGREFIPIYDYRSPRALAAKWKDWKVTFVQRESTLAASQEEMTIHNLLWDPQENFPLGIDYVWVLEPVGKHLGAFARSLKDNPPVPTNSPDPYIPRKYVR